MSDITFRYANMDRSEALEEYTYERMQNLLRRLDGRHKGPKEIEVRFGVNNRDSQGQIKDCEVMVTYRYPGISEPIHIRKNGLDIKNVLVEAIRTAETAVQKETDKFEGGRHNIGKSKRHIDDIRLGEPTNPTENE